MQRAAEENGCWLHTYLSALTNVCYTGSISCKRQIWCSGLTQLKHMLAFGKLLTCSFYPKSFCKYYCNLRVDLGGIWGLLMSALTDSFPLSHITNHLLSTYPVFKAIFSPDSRNVGALKSRHSHTYRSLLSVKAQVPASAFMYNCI